MNPAALFRATAGLSARRPWWVLSLAAIAAVLALVHAGARLELRTSNLDLIDADLPEVQAFNDFADAFGTPNVLVVVLEGDDEAALERAVDRLGPSLAAGPGVERVLDRLPYDDETLEALGVEPYFSSFDGTMIFVFVQPDDPRSSAATIEPFVTGVRERLAAADLAAEGIRAGLTGMPAYALDDRDIVQREVGALSLVSLVLVVVLFLAAFGSFRRPVLAALALLVGVAWTLGIVAAYPGHLTLLSAFFAAILFGLGIDYGIHYIARVEEWMRAGRSELDAIPEAAAGVASGLTTGAATTALVFLSMNLSGFLGFAELGTVAAIGVLMCLLATITVLPALLAVTARPGTALLPAVPRDSRIGRALLRMQYGAIAALLAVLALAGLAARPGFDVDYLDLQPAGSTAVRLERAMIAQSDLSPSFAAFVVDSRGAAAELTDRLLDLATVGEVRSILDLDEIEATAPETGAAPPALARTFESPDGRFAVYAYPDGDIWDADFQERFVSDVRALDPAVTGMPLLGRFMVTRSQRALEITAVLGLAILGVCLLLDFRSPRLALLAGVPALLTVGALLGTMWLCGLAFNPLNVMALPVVLGVAVDDGVHVTHRFLAERGDLRRTLAGTGRSVVLTSATTLAAFGALGFASHRGLASFAWLLSIGVVAALLLSVGLLPWLLRRFDAGREPSARGAAGGALGARGVRQNSAAPLFAVVALVTTITAVASAPGVLASDGTAASASAAEPAAGRDAESRADASWSARAGDFATTGRVPSAPALDAVRGYELALQETPDDLDLRFKTIEALWFAGHFAVTDRKQSRELVDRQVELSEETYDRVLAAAGVASEELEPKAFATKLRGVPGARRALFWSAIGQGVWAMAHGNLAAARRGVGGTIRDRAEALLELDEAFASAGGLRLLGRLHTATPRVPFFTGWVDRRKGIALLRRANEVSQADPRNPLFLAEALADHAKDRSAGKQEALELARAVCARTPDPAWVIEQSESIAAACVLVARLERRR